MDIYILIYFGQVVYGLCVCFLLSGYDAIFIQCIMTISYRFRSMANLLQLITEGPSSEQPLMERDHAKDRQLIDEVYKMHVQVLG